MDIYEAMASRKTIRDFTSQEVSRDLIKKIISAGFFAPTNNHMREWHFITLQDKTKRQELLQQLIKPISTKGAIGIINRWQLTDESQRAMYIDGIPKQFSMLNDAGCLILPCYRQYTPLLKPKDLSALNNFASIWCCIENILVAAAAEGVYGVTRIPNEGEGKKLKQILNIPEDYEIPCYIALGYPAEGAKRAGQVDIKIEDRIHVDAW